MAPGRRLRGPRPPQGRDPPDLAHRLLPLRHQPDPQRRHRPHHRVRPPRPARPNSDREPRTPHPLPPPSQNPRRLGRRPTLARRLRLEITPRPHLPRRPHRHPTHSNNPPNPNALPDPSTTGATGQQACPSLCARTFGGRSVDVCSEHGDCLRVRQTKRATLPFILSASVAFASVMMAIPGRADEAPLGGSPRGIMARASVSSNEVQGNGPSSWLGPSISADGQLLGLRVKGNRSVPRDTNEVGDAFVRNDSGATFRVSVSGRGCRGTAKRASTPRCRRVAAPWRSRPTRRTWCPTIRTTSRMSCEGSTNGPNQVLDRPRWRTGKRCRQLSGCDRVRRPLRRVRVSCDEPGPQRHERQAGSVHPRPGGTGLGGCPWPPTGRRQWQRRGACPLPRWSVPRLPVGRDEPRSGRHEQRLRRLYPQPSHWCCRSHLGQC